MRFDELHKAQLISCITSEVESVKERNIQASILTALSQSPQ